MCWVTNRTIHIKTFKVVDMTIYWKLKIREKKKAKQKTENKIHGIEVIFR